ncbi:RNA-directed DNA polymerase, eukaryota [Tanacetum coccineum]|uniref:RNA-directed DNA polymerase, eukaryota n=1 Tax=Tanacetum coccineum TaxID=301880 RepID=A0ABQ5ANE6_9ASTR
MFENWLASKFVYYKTIDIFTKGALWDYWKLESDEIKPTNEKTFDLEETDHEDEQEIGEIFRIETNLFNYETPLCEKFKEFNYLLKIDPDLLTNDIKGFKTYDEYKDDWIYEWNENVPWVHEKPWTDTGLWTKHAPVREDGYCNGGNFPGAYIVGNTLLYQDLEWYEALKDCELKEEALRNKAILEGLINDDDESNEERCELFDDHEFPVCTVRRFEMIKYSFEQDEEYVGIKEDEYEDLTKTSKEAIHAYQEIFRMMDEGWMVLAERNEIDEVGEVKDFASLTNLKVVLIKEGYDNLELKYMGGFWVMIAFKDDETKYKFHTNLGVGSWFSQLIQAHSEFKIDERVIWVEIEGVPCKWWSRNTFSRIAARWGHDVKWGGESATASFHTNRICICTKLDSVIMELFKMVYRGFTCWVRAMEVPGWVPDFEEDSDGESSDGDPEDEGIGGVRSNRNDLEGESNVEGVPETCFDEEPNNDILGGNDASKSGDPFGIYDIINKKREASTNDCTPKKSCKYPPGFTPDVKGDASVKGIDIVVQETQNKYDQEDGGSVEKNTNVRKETLSDAEESFCSGHFRKSVAPRTGGSIIQFIDDLLKVGQTMGYDMTGCMDNMENIIESQGVNEGNSGGILCIWDPNMFHKRNETLSEKKMLWDYLSVVMTNWNGEVVMMGDFNEVRDSIKRFGSVFNKHGAEAFNNFIANAGLVEVSLCGCSFTWCHKSATKMSKLDRFLISDNLICSSPTISLDRNWNRNYKEKVYSGKRNLKHELTKLDAIIDKGNGTVDTINRRQEVVRLIQDLEKIDTLEAAQKAKIKWSIEGDENSKFEHTDQSGIRLQRDFDKTITVEQKEFLESEVSKEEIKRAVWDCEIDKAPGPDGFTFGFYRQYWSIIKNDVTNIGWTVILNELIQWCKKRKTQNLVFKIDFEKAYDSVRWDFVGEILQKFGFGRKWCMWIQSCLHSSRGSVLVNGSPTREFQFHKGLKQGDPLSPFLFIMVMESLHISFQRVVDAGLFKGIKVGPNIQISHLFYADDAIFMGQWSQSNIDIITHVLDVFRRSSGLSINMNKSKLMGISVDSYKVAHVADKIGYMVLNTPFKYLGSRVGDLMSRTQSWSEVIGSMVSWLSRWKLKTLSIGGILTLLKYVLGAIPIYHMSLFKVPMKVLHNMEAIRARFYNGMDINSRKSSWVRWKNVMASKESGGLGVSSLFALNRALMFKWVWRFKSQQNSLWFRVIKALHGNGGKIGMKSKASYPSLWISIIQETESLKSCGIDLLRFITPVLGNGVNTSFWDVPWRGEVAFKELVPRLYALEKQKDIKVASKLSHGGLEESFRRVPRGGVEQAQLEILKEKMEGGILNSSNDRWSWSLDGFGEFSVSSVRKAIDDSLLPHGTTKTSLES